MFLTDESDTNLTTEPDPVKHTEFRKAWHRGFTPTAVKEYDENHSEMAWTAGG